MADPLGTDTPTLGPFDLPVMPDHFFTNFTPAWSRAFADRLAIVLDGTPITITPAADWTDFGGDHPIYGRRVPGRLLRLSGMLKRTGGPFTTTTSVQAVATIAPAPVWSVTGTTLTAGGMVRFLLARTTGVLSVLTPPGGTAVTITADGYVNLDGITGRV
jgi:hypothetical protein